MLRLEDYAYDLPEEQIAQEPLPRRDASRLLVLDRDTGEVAHRAFLDLPDVLAPGDLVVVNDTRVVPARLLGRKRTGGRAEILLLEATGEDTWRALLAHAPAPGGVVELGEGVSATVLAREGEVGTVRLSATATDLHGALARLGRMPLPPYVHRAPGDPRDATDRERYQTVFAREPGAAAAPTAGLHFTPEVLDRLAARGIARTAITLHVGPGTFLPFRGEEVAEDHRLHEEPFAVPPAAAVAIAETRARGGRVVAVGTTVARTLETAAAGDGTVRAGSGRTRLFLRPGSRFRVVDALLTNFHLPRSSLLVLVCAFAGRERTLAAYREAVRAGYRFYSYGDAMLVCGTR
ncbi:MAG TPA: tRNA preQ1(34) S-adenosylmethionine ribosyltransferase-isomerase QueA [Candidatus Polarisedimenticolaceae bacterium]|nr:tRNA preQ1(34) S-adenosylmethionine ribosyltransferase-isomerase QueA [Candidatus Polarisedimenticolaceae bacterium]